MRRSAIAVGGLPVTALLLLSACSSGPAAVADGTYRAMAASGELVAAPDVTLTVADAQFTFTTAGSADIVTTATPGAEQVVACPPDTTATPDLLGASLTLGNATLAQPAVFGDCGQTTPARITIVDLASAGPDSAPFPFTRWIEFCDTTDPDC